jgi:hypothetical protein
VTMFEQLWIGLVGIAIGAFLIYACRCAYYNGVNDGYGAVKEPWNPGYRKARIWLQKYWGFDPVADAVEDADTEVDKY